MVFSEKLKTKQELINKEIQRIIDNIKEPEIIAEAMKYSLLAGGKRIRPVLSVSICETLGGKTKDVLPFACSLEFIHTYSLIHDDLPAMDNDDLRRGRPTNHVVYGDDIAILAGDGLLNFAFETMLEAVKNNCCRKDMVDASMLIAKCSGANGMIGGQVIDIKSENTRIDLDKLYLMHEKKTGALIEAACLAGCIISGRDEMYDTVKKYSKNLGIAFQIIDDILDYTGDPAKMGKNTGIDSANNKSTFVSILGLEKAREFSMQYSENAHKYACEIDKSGFLSDLSLYLLNRDC
jgi:geranylgeranyl diphosphate synthase type II